MLKNEIRNRLENIKDIPSIPIIAAEILKAMENPLLGAKDAARIIDKDQSLTARILRRANSPIYGFARQISTIDVAVVVLGMDNLREIILTYIVQGFFSKVNTSIFNAIKFWEYSVYTATTARILARKLKYKLAGEAFIAGLMHDLGILIIAEFFTNDYADIKELIFKNRASIIQAENSVLGANHTQIGYWLAEKWNLPKRLCDVILNHHTHYSQLERKLGINDSIVNFNNINQPLTSLISMSELLSHVFKISHIFLGETPPSYYLAEEIFPDISEHDFLDESSNIYLLGQEINKEYQSVMEDYKL